MSIPHINGLEAINCFLKQRTKQHPSTERLLSLTNEVLTKNYFMFQDQYYLQLQDSAMGSPVAPNYGNLFTGKFELDFIYNNNPYSKFTENYWRYIDDLFFIWSGNAEDFRDLHAFINSKMESIKFTSHYDSNCILIFGCLGEKERTALHT